MLFGFKRKAAAPTAAEWRARGNAALGEARLHDAAECYRQALAADPADGASSLNFGYVLLEQGQLGEAAGALERAAALMEGGEADLRADAAFLLGRARHMQGDRGAAVDSFRRA